MPDKPPPQLPWGNPSTLQGVSENFSFHASPESFITQRVLRLHRSNPEMVDSRAPVRAKILNRNVAVVSSHDQVRQVLEATSTDDSGDSPAFVASAAYDKLMGPFFPSPNLLLADGAAYARMRKPWDERVADLPDQLREGVAKIAKAHVERMCRETADGPANLYESMKELAWQILLEAFLGLQPGDAKFAEIEQLQEDLLRGQFSLFPVSINTGLWHSPRKRGINAKLKLQKVIGEHLRVQGGNACPFARSAGGRDKIQEVADHLLLFTSSLAAKGLASLLTAAFCNLFFSPPDDPRRTGCQSQVREGAIDLKSIVLETERLSPPIVGVMRRTTRDVVLISSGAAADTIIPSGWDTWLYFVGAGRDPKTYGPDCEQFRPSRYARGEVPESFAFGSGPKTCLGRAFMHEVICQILHTFIEEGVTTSSVSGLEPEGVRAWLGWSEEPVSPDVWASDVKQLPTQHPTKPIMVSYSKRSDS